MSLAPEPVVYARGQPPSIGTAAAAATAGGPENGIPGHVSRLSARATMHGRGTTGDTRVRHGATPAPAGCDGRVSRAGLPCPALTACSLARPHAVGSGAPGSP